MAIRYHLRLMAVVVNNIRILLIGCAVFLCGLSYAEVEEEDSGALRIETETEEYAADIYLGNTDDRKADRERKTIGVGDVYKRQVLDGINVHIRPGEVVGLVGPSGAGKTTFASFLPVSYTHLNRPLLRGI